MTERIELASRRNDEGASTVEYGLLTGAIATVVLAVAISLGTWVNAMFQDTCDRIDQTGTGVVADGSC
jgi:Flp pilus assembly pilin Flp